MPRMSAQGRASDRRHDHPSGVPLARPFRAAFNGIADQVVGGEGRAVHAREVPFDPLGVVDDVGQAVGRVVIKGKPPVPVDIGPAPRPWRSESFRYAAGAFLG